MKYVDMTPTWVDILPTWQRIAETAYDQLHRQAPEEGADPQGNLERFWAEMKRMAEAADKWNAYAKENVPVEENPNAGQ